jgi:hypothetical protein
MCYSGTESDSPNQRNDLFKDVSSKRNEGCAYAPNSTVLAYQSARDSGLPVRPVYDSIGLKPASLLRLPAKACGTQTRRDKELVYHFGELQPPPGGFDDFENPGWPIFRTP